MLCVIFMAFNTHSKHTANTQTHTQTHSEEAQHTHTRRGNTFHLELKCGMQREAAAALALHTAACTTNRYPVMQTKKAGRIDRV